MRNKNNFMKIAKNLQIIIIILTMSFSMSYLVNSALDVPFSTVTLNPAFSVNGVGTDIDTIAFWEAPNPSDTLMFVSAKGNKKVEVWKYPFEGNEQDAMSFASTVNSVAVDQETDLLYVGVSGAKKVMVYSLPSLTFVREFGSGTILTGETGLAILKKPDGSKVIYVTSDHKVHMFTETGTSLGDFSPPVVSMETMMADNFHQLIHVPEEQGASGNEGVYLYNPDGTEHNIGSDNRYGSTPFEGDQEGIWLYSCPSDGLSDNGKGLIFVTDQLDSGSEFEVFNRETYQHLGKVKLTGVTGTDGIAITQKALPDYPEGLFTAHDHNVEVAGIGMDVIMNAIGLSCPDDDNPTVNIVSPANGATITTSDVLVDFSASNWNVGGKGSNHIHFHVDNVPGLSFSDHLMFYNGANNIVELNEIPGTTTFATWVDSNTIRLNNLPDGSHSIRAHLATTEHVPPGNPEADKTITITVDTDVGDTTPPVISNGQPTGNLPAGTTQVTLSVQTDEAATCKYSSTPGVAYDSMSNIFSVTGGTTHTKEISLGGGGGGKLDLNATMTSNSNNFDTKHPVQHLWDGCLEGTPACSSGAGNIASFWVEFDFQSLKHLNFTRLYGDANGNWQSRTWSFKYKVNSGDAWTTAFSNENAFFNDWSEKELNVDARYVRVEVVGNPDVPATQARELEIYFQEEIVIGCDGDLDGNNQVNQEDIIAMLSSFNNHCGDEDYNGDADLNHDCVVNVLDGIKISNLFGICPV